MDLVKEHVRNPQADQTKNIKAHSSSALFSLDKTKLICTWCILKQIVLIDHKVCISKNISRLFLLDK